MNTAVETQWWVGSGTPVAHGVHPALPLSTKGSLHTSPPRTGTPTPTRAKEPQPTQSRAMGLLPGVPRYWAEEDDAPSPEAVKAVYRLVTCKSEKDWSLPLDTGVSPEAPRSQSDSCRGELLKAPRVSKLKLSSFMASQRFPFRGKQSHVTPGALQAPLQSHRAGAAGEGKALLSRPREEGTDQGSVKDSSLGL